MSNYSPSSIAKRGQFVPLRTKQFRINMTPEEHERLVRLCQKQNTTGSSFFRDALCAACKKANIK